jgi:hypothetical protein
MLSKSTAGQPAGHTPTDLVLDRLPSGELAWLRAELDAAIHDADHIDHVLAGRLERDRRYVLTDAGRRDLHDYVTRQRALDALFGQPWPTAAEVAA